MPEFRIQVERLTDQKEHFDFEADPAWWRARQTAEEAEETVVDTPFHFSLNASRVSEDIVIEGDFEGSIGLECSRCAKRYPHALREPYRLVLEPLHASDVSGVSNRRSDGALELDPEGEKGLAENGVYLGEDLEVGAYRGAVVGLDDFFGEVIALAMPIQPLCDDECLGICTHCGAARVADPAKGCGCEDEKIESPFAVLAALKDRD